MAANQKPARNAKSNVLPLGERDKPWQPSGAEDRQEFFLPVSGFVWFYPEEVRVIDHPAFQRLGKIYQLGQAYHVFRGATHKRLEHVLGAVHVIQRMINALRINAKKSKHDPGRRARLNLAEERFVRLGALLHDIGHLASGHTLEDELGLFGKHDEDERLDYIFQEANWGPGNKVERLASVIDQSYKNYLPEPLRGQLTPTDIVRLLVRKEPKTADGGYDKSKDKYAKQKAILEKSSDIRMNVCMNMIGNTLCADLLDYIHRDWYHVGKPLEQEDRLYQYMEIRNPKGDDVDQALPDEERRHHSDLFVLSLGTNVGYRPKIRTDGISAILSLLEKRYELAETVLYHKTKLSAGAMLGRALHELWSSEDSTKLPARLLNLSDEQLVEYALSEAAEKLNSAVGEEKASIEAATYLLSRLNSRRLYRSFHTIRNWDLHAGPKEKIASQFFPPADDTGLGATNRANAARQFERDLELPPGSVVISLTSVKAKVAQVQIRVNDTIETFAAYEEKMKKEKKRGLSGGHLDAQIQRFDDLWRCDFFVDKDVLEGLEANQPHKLNILRELIRALYISPADDSEQTDFLIKQLASSYVKEERASGRNNIEEYELEKIVAARGVDAVAEQGADVTYNGVNVTLASYWRAK